jgi:glucosamine 6-phosphate synthetase-like amidotransferase/phosphosugar isomerase protein
MFADVLICQQIALEVALKLKRNVDHPKGLHKVVKDNA